MKIGSVNLLGKQIYLSIKNLEVIESIYEYFFKVFLFVNSFKNKHIYLYLNAFKKHLS